MDEFLPEHSEKLFEKEWLVKTDAERSVPYLMKCGSNSVDGSIWLMVTNTKQVWAEVLSGRALARRWLACNPTLTSTWQKPLSQEHTRRVADVLERVHTFSGIADASFEVVESVEADLAIELVFDGFKWRWDTYSLGPKTGADIISKHLILPLISTVHIAFSSPDAVGEIPEGDLGALIEKVGRTARRIVDSHIKHVISKPRVATALQRMTAVFNHCTSIPQIRDDEEDEPLKAATELIEELSEESKRIAFLRGSPGPTIPTTSANNINHRILASIRTQSQNVVHSASTSAPKQEAVAESDTETEDESGLDEKPQASNSKQKATSIRVASSSPTPAVKSRTTSNLNRTRKASDEEASSSPPEAKRSKKAVNRPASSDSDSSPRRPGTTSKGAGASKSVRQPVRKAGRRF